MKHLLHAAILTVTVTPIMAADIGVSITLNQPGLYGQINIGDVPQPPQVIYAQPVVVVQDRRNVGSPVYLHVPPGHERHWAKHCAEYGACGRPVYFVRDDWYNREYVPRHPHDNDHGKEKDGGHGHGEGHGHKHDHDD